jgi:MFS family permease
VSQPSAFAPLRERNFRWFYASEVVNILGNNMAGIALAFAVLDVSDDPRALGYVLAAESIPLVVFLLVGGVIADRLPRVLVLRVGSVVLAATQGAVALLVITGAVELWMMVVLAAANGIAVAIVFPAYAGLVPQLVPRQMLQQANVLQSIARGSLRIIGPTVAALLVVGFGAGWALAVDSVSWLVAGIMLVKVRIPARPPSGVQASAFTELREGWSLFAGTTWLWVVVAAFSLLNAIHSGAWFTLGPAYAKDTIGARGWGYLLSAEAIGLLLCTAVMLRYRLERPLLVGMIAVAFVGLPIALLGTTENLPLLIAASLLAGAGVELFNLAWNLTMQENIEERMLSRAYSYDMLGSVAAVPIGQLTFGVLGVAFGIQDVLVVSGIAYAAIALTTLASREVRRLPRAPLGPGPVEAQDAS